MTQRVLILCTHNSARSQMAEGLLRHMAGDRFEVASAGTEKTAVRPEAIEAMRRRGIDIRGHTSKTVDQFLAQPWDYVITVCDEANEACPFFPGARQRLYWNFPDPSVVEGAGRQDAFDRTADALQERIRQWLATLPSSDDPPKSQDSN
jgi:arsenate reductase